MENNQDLVQENQEAEEKTTNPADDNRFTAEDAANLLKTGLNKARSGEEEEEKHIPTKPKGYDPVEIKDPVVKDRVNYLYRQVKQKDEDIGALKNEFLRTGEALNYALQQIEQFKQKSTQKEETDAVKIIKDQIKNARALGNDDEAEELNEKLIDLKADQRFNQRLTAREQEEAQKRQAQPQEQKPIFTNDEVAYVQQLRQEADKDGNPIRPWLTKGDKDFYLAQTIASDIAMDFVKDGKNATLDQIMTKVDETMFERNKIKQPAKAAAGEVLSGRDLTSRPKNNQIKLSEEQKFFMKKLNIPEEKYTKILKDVNALNSSKVSIDDFVFSKGAR